MTTFLLTVFSSHDSSAGDLFSKDRFLDQDKPWNITAKSMSYRANEKIYDAEGDVVISSGDQSLYSQKASWAGKVIGV